MVIVLVFKGTWFLLMSPFLRIPLFLPTRSTLVRGRMMICSLNDDLFIYTLASPALASVLPLTKPPITQVYAQRLHPPILSPHSCSFIASLVSISLLNKVSKALAHPIWRTTMLEEMDALTDNGTWNLVRLPAGKKAIGCR